LSRTWFIIAVLTLCPHAFAGKALHEPLAIDQPAEVANYSGAAERGDADAQYQLAVLYHEGHDIPRDLARAAYWYTQAGQRGNTEAQYWLCVMYREGIGVGRDYAEAFYWCKRAAEQGHPQALFAVGQYYFDGLGHGFHRDYLHAYIWFNRAQTQGDEDAPAMIKRLEDEMTPLQVSEAKRLASDWKPRR
jgi:TPR repeat protein